MQSYGFARLEVTPEQAKIPQVAFERVRKWLVEQLELPKEKRWIDFVNVSKPSEKKEGEEDVEDNPSDSLYTSHPVVSCMKAVCELLNIDENWLFEELLDDRMRASKTYEGPRDTSYQYGASVLRIYNYRNKAANGKGPAEVDPNDNSCGVHADLGLVTVSPLATVPGLQMWNLE
ncbi:hypothetical protein PHYSODRAFT_341876 [Phytophthora sojae]|uniref:Isopenicillin N synthase-like Fe(2+) 2OG dioxygenase domain-containing protein n=1 Tax=Phytophthora sojae (strain P6497) TaxID=1094619 RepID=G4YMM8_PHYSP|nr:hypothetical protein PHYSODRAFT_322521 [Phytophthora sojae]XP_009538524.1 hypothetical protein PHYSODRAFT_341876 [Phytophthora sojae]EGZ05663.1 hypothetical protein PHYSODRAFT_341876 [Phytophthora sojae]EGZ28903.1 hypothetical protein PHYSODRAFT_322521 [Phytophthora sojae]|eukprot:XP_009516178.1 hypothetical protein PHYSODRAFT_322521 [Phytophthora sojae]